MTEKKLIICKYCGGSGLVKVPGGPPEQCPKCGGTGKVEEEK